MGEDGRVRSDVSLAGWLMDSADGFDPLPVRVGDCIKFPIKEDAKFKGEDLYPTYYAFPSEDAARAAMAHIQLTFSLIR